MEIEFFTAAWFAALASIIAIDLVLAGDNAVVIALAARSLPKDLQRRAVIWGTLGAIIVRIVATIFAVILLGIPGLLAVGGLILFWIAYNLVRDQDSGEDKHAGAKEITGFWAAMKTIIIADAVMGLDNILAITGAAKGDIVLVSIGLVISIPIVMFGSLIILSYIKKNPWIVWLGGALLGYVGGSMIASDPVVVKQLGDAAKVVGLVLQVVPTVVVFILGYHFRPRQASQDQQLDQDK